MTVVHEISERREFNKVPPAFVQALMGAEEQAKLMPRQHRRAAATEDSKLRSSQVDLSAVYKATRFPKRMASEFLT